jgi:hypothetical protein
LYSNQAETYQKLPPLDGPILPMEQPLPAIEIEDFKVEEIDAKYAA